MTRTADFLLVDLGNTTAKLRLATPGLLLSRTRRLATATLVAPGGVETLRKTLAGWRFHRVLVSSVVPAAACTVLTALPDALSLHGKLDTGVDLRGYPGAKALGADRLANLAGALALYGPGPLIVADFGTAATFNALDGTGRFLGGVIAPGLAAMNGYLPGHTAQLPPIRLAGAAPAAIGRDTRAALRAGTFLGYRGLVREIVEALQEELTSGTRVVATGGDARFLAQAGLAAFDTVDPDLTLQGLRIIAARCWRK